ncbi:MAG TPA: PKD domain-containing protein [Candidatus Krumholzibacteria bacterium]|nr:PKD domain-containing protein [Candidatus Krumholzibacteria bacterium]
MTDALLTPDARFARACAAFFAAAVLASALAPAPASAQSFQDPDFYAENAASGATFTAPTTLAFAPDGRVFVGEKSGLVYIIQNDTKLPTPFIDLSWDVLNHHDRGLLGMVLDPDFANTRYVYFLYTFDWNQGGDNQRTDVPGRLVRYQASLADPNVADLNTRTVLIGGTYATGIPACYFSHAPAALRIGSDGTLLIAAGDGASYNQVDPGNLYEDCFGATKFPEIEDIGAYRSQWIGSMSGKILRVDRATGLGLPSNPYYTGNPADVQSKVWAYGLRNPYRFGVRPNGSTNPADGDPGSLYIGDVGWNLYEEVNVSRAGGGENFGWPCREGPNAQGQYQSGPQPAHHGCSTIGTSANPGPLTNPLTYWHHSNGNNSFPSGITGATAIGGAFYQGTRYPAQYQGVYFYGDYSAQFIKALTVNANDQFVSQMNFGSSMGGVVDIGYNPTDEFLYYINIFTGSVMRIRHVDGDINSPPVASATVEPRFGPLPLNVQFDASASMDPDGNPITFRWEFGDGQSSTQAVTSHAYTTDGAFVARLTVRDSFGAEATLTFDITAGNTPPNGTIVYPVNGSTAAVGELVVLWGEATDDDTPSEDLTFHWVVSQVHNLHTHPDFFVGDGKLLVFNVTEHGLPHEVNLLRVDMHVSDGSLTDTTTHFVVLARPGETDITGDGTPIALITSPTGSGNPSLSVIHDAVFPIAGSVDPMQQYDTFTGGAPRAVDWIGYSFLETRYFSKLVFQEGIHFADGGWFDDLDVEVLEGSTWLPVANLQVVPPYRANDGINFDMYTLTFTAQAGTAVRVVGAPGGSADYISVGELRVFEIPRADFGADVRIGSPPLTVQFTDLSNVTGATAWLWRFGDGATSAEQNPSHVYSVPGPHTVNLTVSGPSGIYFEEKLDYVFVGTPGITGEYFDGLDFTGPSLTRVDPNVDFDWAFGSPDPSMGTETFSVRWTGWVRPPFTEDYTFRTLTDDGVRLWIDGELIIDQWVLQAATEWTGSVPLVADRMYEVRMEFFDNTAHAVARLSWSSASQPLEVIPQSRLWVRECGQGVGDMDGNGSLTPGDALCVFNTYLNGQVVPGACDAVGYDCEGPAADADCSGLVTPGDALAVYQRYLLGQPVEECLGQAGPALAASFTPARVTTSRRTDAGAVEVAFAVDPTAHFDAFGVRVVVPAGFELAGFERGAGTSDWMLVDARADEDGALWVGGFDTRGLDAASSTELFRLRFRFVGLDADPDLIRFIDFVDDLAGAVEDGGAAPGAPSSFRLYQNHPNPFNPQTSIRFDVPAEAGRVPVTLAIYSVRGERIRTLLHEERAPGIYSVTWDGRDQNGVAVGSGVYFYSLRAGDFTSSRRMVLLK